MTLSYITKILNASLFYIDDNRYILKTKTSVIHLHKINDIGKIYVKKFNNTRTFSGKLNMILPEIKMYINT